MDAEPTFGIAPGPRGTALPGVVFGLWRDPLGTFRRLRREHGDVVLLPLRHRAFYLVTHPAQVARVLQRNADHYGKSTRTYAKIRSFLGDGLVTSEGAAWARQRRLVQPAFHGHRIREFAGLVADLASEAMESWEARARRGEPVEPGTEMTRLTLRIVGRAFFGTEVGGGSEEIGRAITVALEHTTRMAEGLLDLGALPTPGRRRFRSALRKLDGLVSDLVEETRRRPGADRHFLSLLLDAGDETTGEGLTDREVRDQVLTLLLAGHETTATALTWTCYLLSRNAAEQERLGEEARGVLDGRPAGYGDLRSLPYTRAVLQEALRLFPPLWLLERRALVEDVLGGVTVPEGATIALCPYLTHRHPDFWEDPDRFDPDRFLPGASGNKGPYAYFPFGGGPRACVGGGFAMMEAQLILATLASRFRLRPGSEREVKPRPGITLRPGGPIPLRLQERGRGRVRASGSCDLP